MFYIFNSSGIVSNIGVTGIKELDSICVFIYPWIMCLLFVVSGVATKYSLKNKTNKEFIKDRAKRILLPSIIGIFAYGWISGWMTNYYTDVLNTPVITVYRWGIYLLMFLFGYYIFSNDNVIEKLEKISITLGITTLIIGIVFTIINYGVNFGSDEFLTNIFTNIYLWLVILSAFGLSKRFLNFNNKFKIYMNKNNFSFYVLHYTVQIVIAFTLGEYIKLNNFIFNYIILAFGTIIVLPIITEIVKRIPIVNKLLIGISKKK